MAPMAPKLGVMSQMMGSSAILEGGSRPSSQDGSSGTPSLPDGAANVDWVMVSSRMRNFSFPVDKSAMAS